MKPQRFLTVRQRVDDFIDNEQPRPPFRCDWITDPLALGLVIFPLAIYEKMRQLKHVQDSSSGNLETSRAS